MLSITVLIPSVTFVTTVFILSKASPADNVIIFQIFIITFFAPSIINVIPLITFCTPFFIVSVFNVNIPTMTWNTPDIVQTGTISIAGINTPIPKLGIQWYAKGGIMTRPTMFGMNGGFPMVGGESGAEAILPLDRFWNTLQNYMKPVSANEKPSIINQINVTVYSNGEDDDTLANKVAKRIVEVLENM